MYVGLRSEDEYQFREKTYRFYVPDEPDGQNIFLDRRRSESSFGVIGFTYTYANGNMFELAGTMNPKHSMPETFVLLDSTQTPTGFASELYGTSEKKGWDIQVGYHIKLLKNVPDLKWKRHLGIFLNLSSASMEFNPVYENVYRLERSRKGIALGFTSRLQRNITRRLFLDLSASFFVINYQLDFTGVRNPNFTKEQQENTVLEGYLFNRVWLRAGVGYTLFSKENEK